MTDHLGYEKHASEGRNSGNSRNGKHSKKLQGEHGAVDIEVPRDRNGDFEPQIVPKGQRRLPGFDEKIISLYTRGMTTREIQGAPGRVIRGGGLADANFQCHRRRLGRGQGMAELTLDPVYPVLYLDALFLKVKDQGGVRNSLPATGLRR